MGILFKKRGKLESIFDTNNLENFGLSQIGVNATTIKVFDDPEIPLDYIRSKIVGNSQTDQIHFIYDNS